MQWGKQKWISLLGTFTLIPWDLFLAFGFTFSFKGGGYDTILDRAFVWATFYCTVPAVLVSWFLPKIGGYAILTSTAASIVIEILRKTMWYLKF
jgi:hypothetical protein